MMNYKLRTINLVANEGEPVLLIDEFDIVKAEPIILREFRETNS